ncbi:MAG: ABC transporter substrate-binding protein [Campylobacteraceae bacterium]|nr:ABC transporter substrate-binding protein [Campylobacteraceae bacterium]
MRKFLKFIVALGFVTSLSAKDVTIDISYSLGWFEPLHKELIENFEKENPGIKVNLRVATPTYNEGSAKLMREKIIKQLPDIAFVSFSNLGPLHLRDVPVQLDEFFTEEDAKKGFTKEMLNPAIIDGKIYGVPFVASLPITYYNMDLVRQAGWDKELPTTWEELFELSAMISKLDGKEGMYFDNGNDNWLYIALIMSQGGSLTDENGKVGFNNEIGLWANQKLHEMYSLGKMPNYNISNANKSFFAGNLGIMVASSAGLSTKEEGIANKFELKTSIFPGVKEGGKLPVGGSVAMLTASTKEKQDAAMKYIKYISGEHGNTIIVKHTGYMPVNKLAQENLKEFYAKNPNQQAAPAQADIMGPWPSFPGDNSIKAIDILRNYVEGIMRGEITDYKGALQEATDKINKIL